MIDLHVFLISVLELTVSIIIVTALAVLIFAVIYGVRQTFRRNDGPE